MNMRKDVSLIVACDLNNAIGKDNKLCWHIPSDLKRFKALTEGSVVIMGRKTFESIGKPLKGRTNIIMSRDKFLKVDGCFVVDNWFEAMMFEPDKPVFILGGSEIYSQGLKYVDKIYLTRVNTLIDEPDTYISPTLTNGFKINNVERCFDNGISYNNLDYIRYEATKEDNK